MKPAVALPLAALLAVPAHLVVRGFIGGTSIRASGEAAVRDTVPTAKLDARLEALAQRTSELWRRIEQLAPRAPGAAAAAPHSPFPEERIAGAVERWLAANELPLPEAERRDERATRGRDAEAAEIAKLPIPELMVLLNTGTLGDTEVELVFHALRESGRLDEYVAAMEKAVEDNPTDANVRVALGVAYLQQLFGADAGPESGLLAMRADQAFDEALELDPTNWDARFVKAIALSNWPPFMGRQEEAIQHFQTLIQQQEAGAPEPGYAQTYLFLGNMYQQMGEPAKALETWRAGLTLFPLHDELQKQVDLADG